MSILLLEDNDLDAELMTFQLREALPDTITHRVSDRESFEAALAAGDIELIVSDFSLPTFDGLSALKLARIQAQHIPFIIVSGVVGEELAIAALKEGAIDYVMKQRLERLGAAAQRALAEAEGRRERKRIEDALRDSEARFRVMADSAPALIWTTDEKAAVTFANHHFEHIFGIAPGEMLESGWRRVMHADDVEAFSAKFRQAMAERTRFEFEVRVYDRDGAIRWLKCDGAPRFDGSQQLLGYTGVNIDITETKTTRDALEHMVALRTAELSDSNKRLRQEFNQRVDADNARVVAEDQLRQAQKMEVFGQLTGGVAHDFNNLLTVILGNVETLERRLSGMAGATGDERIVKALQHAKQGAQRAAALTERLLAFARRQPLRPRQIDPNQLVQGMSELLFRTLGEQIEIYTDLAPSVWFTRADPHLLENALLNLAVNARDAMIAGGRLSITTSNAEIARDGTPPFKGIDAGQYVLLSIADTGTGMPPEIIDKVFEPFFTTKDIGSGTGLGLSQVYGFVKQSGGHIDLHSELGQGTRIDIYLPRLEGVDVAAPVQPDTDPSVLIAKGETILVVEDDEGVRAHSTAILRDLGYDVIEAADGHAALAIIQSAQRISLMFTDVGLPRAMNGRELAEAAHAVRPELPVLFTSGYAEGPVTRGGRLEAGVELLSKPFTFVALANRVRVMLDAVEAAELAGSADAAAPDVTSAPTQPVESAGLAETTPVSSKAAPGRSHAIPRVLVVDDEPMIRMIAVETLEDAGYEVAEAENAAEALSLMQAEPFDAIILDVGLPDMKGDVLAHQLLALRADLAIVMASGYHAPELKASFPADSRMLFLQKPYPSAALEDALATLGVSLGNPTAHE
ncbi:response regulator [Schauerella aestuarii]|uniref:response regulator n=1 Tax=Schauerella aestuarii TaxID=2511204 RepID=UPI00136D7B7D|nr:response regulator [Achromobacter aestuarii]MYZ42402.1 response regulator [Achromobacter aestuarii]